MKAFQNYKESSKSTKKEVELQLFFFYFRTSYHTKEFRSVIIKQTSSSLLSTVLYYHLNDMCLDTI